jgi:hypothetical protein
MESSWTEVVKRDWRALYSGTVWSRVLLEKLTVAQEMPIFYGIKRGITVLIRASRTLHE